VASDASQEVQLLARLQVPDLGLLVPGNVLVDAEIPDPGSFRVPERVRADEDVPNLPVPPYDAVLQLPVVIVEGVGVGLGPEALLNTREVVRVDELPDVGLCQHMIAALSLGIGGI